MREEVYLRARIGELRAVVKDLADALTKRVVKTKGTADEAALLLEAEMVLSRAAPEDLAVPTLCGNGCVLGEKHSGKHMALGGKTW